MLFRPELGDYGPRVIPDNQLKGAVERNSPQLLKTFADLLGSLEDPSDFYYFIRLFEAVGDRPVDVNAISEAHSALFSIFLAHGIFEISNTGLKDIVLLSDFGKRLFDDAYAPFKLAWAKKRFEGDGFRSADLDPKQILKPSQEVHGYFIRYLLDSMKSFSAKKQQASGTESVGQVQNTAPFSMGGEANDALMERAEFVRRQAMIIFVEGDDSVN